MEMTDMKRIRFYISMLGISMLAVGACQASTAELTEAIEDALAEQYLLSAVVAVRSDDSVETWSDGHLTLNAARAPDAATSYQIGSITKAFTNLLLAEMVARGKVTFDTTIASVLGDDVEFANPRIGEISLLELSTHSSGLPRLPGNLGATSMEDPYAAFDEVKLLDALAVVRKDQPLTDRYAYSNFGAGVLGYILGRVHGGGYRAALREHVIGPMGLAATGFEPIGDVSAAYTGDEVVPAWTFDALAGAGALWSTADDLMLLGEFLLEQRDWPLVQDADVNRKIVVPDADSLALTRVWHVIESEDGPVYWHNGGTAGHRSFFGFRPATGEALVLLFSGRTDPTELALAWFDLRRPGDASEAVDATIFGQYEFAPGAGIGVFERDGVPVAQLSGQTASRLYPAGEDRYSLNTADASLRFIRSEEGVAAVELVQNGRIQRAARIADQAAALERQAIDLPRDALSEYTGRFQLAPGSEFTIRLVDDGLEAKLSGQPFFPIYPRGDDVFFYRVVDAELHFERGEAGSVEALVLHQGGIEQRALRME